MREAVTKRFRGALVCLAATSIIAATTVVASASSVSPSVFEGNPKCDRDFDIDKVTKFDPPKSGTKDGVTLTMDGKKVVDSWSSIDPLHIVIVKGGPRAHIYEYAGGATGDSDLISPLNNGGNLPDVSHVEFCRDPSVPEPTEEPTEQPTEEPTEEPSEEPTEQPTEEPTEQPTEEPTEEPTEQPTEQPTEEPTEQPTEQPTEEPSEEPTVEPTEQPTEDPADPTVDPGTEVLGNQFENKPETKVLGRKYLAKTGPGRTAFTAVLGSLFLIIGIAMRARGKGELIR